MIENNWKIILHTSCQTLYYIKNNWQKNYKKMMLLPNPQGAHHKLDSISNCVHDSHDILRTFDLEMILFRSKWYRNLRTDNKIKHKDNGARARSIFLLRVFQYSIYTQSQRATRVALLDPLLAIYNARI